MLQQENTREASNSTAKTKTKVERAIEPKLKAELEKIESLLPKDPKDFGTERDQAMKAIKSRYNKLVENNKPDFKTQMDLLQKKASAGGSFNPTEYSKLMEDFRDRTAKEGVGILPEPLEKVRTMLKKAEADAAPESVARKSLLALDKSNFGITFPALMRENYSRAVEALHQIENPKAETPSK